MIALGTWEDTTTFSATAIGVRRDGQEGQRAIVRGRVVSVGSDTIGIGTARGPVTALVDDETTYRIPGVEAPGLNDIEPGAWVVAGGTWTEDGALHAAVVAVRVGDHRRGSTSGRK